MKYIYILFLFIVSTQMSFLIAQEIQESQIFSIDVIAKEDLKYTDNKLVYKYENNSMAKTYTERIDSIKIKEAVYTLASDEFEGRGSGEPGGEKAVNYLVDHLKKTGVQAGNKNSYIQNINGYFREGNKQRFQFNNFNYTKEIEYYNRAYNDSLISDNEIIFVGYGSYSPSYNDFQNVDITNKTILMLDGIPQNKYGISYASDGEKNNRYLSDYIKTKRPKAVIKINDNFSIMDSYYYNSKRLTFDENPPEKAENFIPEIKVNELLGNKILESLGKTVKQIKYEIERDGMSPTQTIEKAYTLRGQHQFEDANINNVIGVIPGSDLKDEYVVVSAHYDHEGKNNTSIYNGADDNASGVSSLLEIARVFAQAKKEGKGPRRSIIFLFPAAEEKGLYGSLFYVDNPLYPLNKTIACINLDMVGRMSNVYQPDNFNNYVYVVNDKSRSGNLVKWVDAINKGTDQLKLDYKHTTPGDSDYLFSRSDQYNFAKKDVPAIMFTSGMHKDYHRYTDDAELIDYNGLYKRTKLAFNLVWELANSDQKPIKNQD